MLAHVKCIIGAGHQMVEFQPRILDAGNADAGRDLEHMAIEGHVERLGAAPELFQERGRFIVAHSGQEQSASSPPSRPNTMPGVSLIGNPTGEHLQHPVAGHVAKSIVDLLK